MGKIVINKHFDSKDQITSDKFVNKGELIISNQVGFEGIFIKNNNGEILYIGPTEGTGTDIPLEYKKYVEAFVDGRLSGYITSATVNSNIGAKVEKNGTSLDFDFSGLIVDCGTF